MNDEARLAAEERLEILRRARAFDDMIESAGWKYIFALQNAWLDKSLKILREVDTQDVTRALDALQKWQIAEKLIDTESNYINSTLSQAKEIRGVMTIDDALMMEQVQNEQQRPDPTGY